MSLGYVDSSCLVAVALGEEGHERVASRLDGFEQLLSSALLEAEVLSAVQREGLDPGTAVDYIGEIEWVLPRRPLSGEIAAAQAAGHLRGGDLWHVACALFVRDSMQRPIEFVTLDEPQRKVAAELGFLTSA